jgi:hypothetical protein
MQGRWFALILVLCPLLSLACAGGDRKRCKESVSELIRYRSEAIGNAFGDTLGVLAHEIEIKFVRTDEPQHKAFSGRIAYDESQQSLIVPRRHLSAKMPRPLRWALSYWPYYKNSTYRAAFPIIEAIDNALWGAYLQEAAKSRDLTWPHDECRSAVLRERLPCEMIVEGVEAHLTKLNTGIFNANRLDRIWPEDFSAFERRVWRRQDQAYLEVKEYGGILLLRPLIDEFGVPNVLAYVARNPFRIEADNLHLSARRYQERAREALRIQLPADVTSFTATTH